MAQFAILLYGPAPGDMMDTPPEEMDAHMAFGEKLDELGGAMSDAQALLPSPQAKSVLTGGAVKDGTFLGGDQVVIGFGLLDAKDIDHAITICKHNPATWRGGVEIRPLFVPPSE